MNAGRSRGAHVLRVPARSSVLAAIIVVALGGVSAQARAQAQAQVADSTRVPAAVDTAGTPAETDTVPSVAAVLTSALEPARFVETQPGVIVYDLAVPGWPTSAFVRGTSPNDVGLAVALDPALDLALDVAHDVAFDRGSVYFNDTFTGRPRYDLIPVQLLEVPTLRSARDGFAQAMAFDARQFGGAQPQTEATYWSSNKDLQHVRIMHAQRRRLGGNTRGASPANASAPDTAATGSFPGDNSVADSAATSTAVSDTPPPRSRSTPPDPTIVDMLVTYHGAAATGEFPGSKLERARQFGTRIGIERQRFGFALHETYNGRSVGAHGGVNPPIYQRLGASVQNPTARRWSRRNDLAASGWAAVSETSTIHALASWTAATERYTTSSDTTEARSRRFVGEASATLPLPRVSSQPASVFVRAETAEVVGTRGYDGAATVSDLQVGGDINVQRRRVAATTRAGLQRTGGQTGPFASATLSVVGSRTHVTVTASSNLRRAQLVDAIGFGDYLTSTNSKSGNAGSSFKAERASTVDVRASTHVGALRVGVSAFHSVRNNAIEYFETAVADSVSVEQADSAVRVSGAGAQLAFRDTAGRGFYLRVRGDTYTVTGGAAAAASAPANAIAGTLPDLFGVGQIGFRQTLFQGDLIADLAVRGRAWTAMRSRVLHPPTGLLVVPTTDVTNTAEVPASGALDVVLTARVRTATIWFLYENALSGTNVLTGNLMVPGYPLEEQRIRFGVHWPIFG